MTSGAVPGPRAAPEGTRVSIRPSSSEGRPEVSAAAGLPEDAAKRSLRRVRRRVGRLLREEIARTVERKDQVDDELRYLLAVVRGGSGRAGTGSTFPLIQIPAAKAAMPRASSQGGWNPSADMFPE